MGKIQFQTKEQQLIFEEIAQNEFLSKHFYFTGGTALSSVYLQHRYSDDLDFFSTEQFDNQVIFTLLGQLADKHHFTFQSRQIEVVYIFSLIFANKAELKLDFAYYPYKQLEESKVIDGMKVDSLQDIAVNKLLTVSQRSDVKDFVDLYFLLQEFTVWDLMEGVKIKFKVRIDPFLLGADLLKVEDFDYLPKMITPLEIEDLKSFFRQKAKDISGKSVE